MLAEDGSGKGAGLAAAIALRLKKRQYWISTPDTKKECNQFFILVYS